MFHDYMQQFDAAHARKGLRDLFRVLNQKPEDRDPYLADDDQMLAAFPYVNGGLFDGDDIEIPPFTDEIMDLLLRKASDDFDWSEISPTIFGAVFESTLNPETRRSGGMHYTSIENIHKVIDPLFLDDLKAEFEEIKNISVLRTQEKKLHALQDKLASLSFLDPSAGSGNFLTESYLQLRKLENEILRLLTHGQITFGYEGFSPIKVSISQFYGIEINDFAVTVARTALWIAENQMLKETEDIVHMQLDFLPLKTNAYIVEGNALRIDWNDVVDKSKLNYIMGNPPFVGHNLRSNAQKEDISIVFGKGETESKLDYVICWYQKAIEYMETAVSHITAAFVSTNSICQGESVPAFWKQLVVDHKAEIQFAYSTFIWDSEASSKAHVHCVIVGFTYGSVRKPKKLFDGSDVTEVDHINPYIIAAPDVWLESRTNKPQGSLPKMTTGSQPMDYGNFILDAEERETLVSKYPVLAKYIKPFIGAHEFLHDRIGQYSRYCLWLDKADLSEIRNIPEVKERIERVRQLRTESKIDRVKKKADLPYLFCQIRQPKSTYLVIPRHSSQTRRYIPFGFIQPEIIAGDACTIIPDLGLYEFGILTSNVHMAWVRVVCGRIKSDFRYQASVYNNFPWPQPAEKEKQRIAETAQGILDARFLYSNSCLADLYDPTFMPPELRKAHMNNDRAVMQAYGMPIKETDEAACVAWLMKLYQEKVNEPK
ncbi:Methyltransferase domain-containing protein [Sarcina sp. DSM 11001]|nr:Methyltransferase domain-containing protein [Sarcina sp. DSM 11001]